MTVPGPMSEFTIDQVTPIDFKFRREQAEMVVTWKDGHISHLDNLLLRKNCPCATCNSERQSKPAAAPLLPILKGDPGKGPPAITGAQLVGNYAIQLTWSDGHNTGIYDFRLLRSLDQSGRS